MSGAPLRVLYLHHAPMLGGSEASLLCLLRHLPEDRVAAFLACPGADSLGGASLPPWIPRQQIAPWIPRRTLSPVALLRDFAGLRQIGREVSRLAAEHHASVIHANSWQAAAIATTCSQRLPLIWHVRDLRIPSTVTRWLRSRCSRAIAISGAVRGMLLQRGFPPSRLSLVYNGVELDALPSREEALAARRELGVPEGVPLVGSVSQLVPWKRHDRMLGAAALVLRVRPDARFVFVGGPPPGVADRTQLLADLARVLGISSSVIFTGYRTDALRLLAACDVFIHGAADEPLGRVALEAMALARPVVAINAAGPAELIENGVSGLLVAPDRPRAILRGLCIPASSDDFADAILRMLDAPDFAWRCGAAARERVASHFSVAAMVAGTLQVYDGLQAED